MQLGSRRARGETGCPSVTPCPRIKRRGGRREGRIQSDTQETFGGRGEQPRAEQYLFRRAGYAKVGHQ